ncbi:MAG TPA: EamA family transporter [Streptosporangiaceae bacterium]|nr:EamA family transporter [Streptosporangiaceae bacterium]
MPCSAADPGDRAAPAPGRLGACLSRVSGAGGAIAILLGAAAWGSTGTAAHFAPAGASAASIGAARIVLGGAILLALAAGREHRAAATAMLAAAAAGGSARVSLALAVIAVGGYQLCFFGAVRLTGVAVGTVLAIGSAPVFTGMISRLTGGPALTIRWLIATVAAVAGCGVLVTGGKAAGVQLGGVGLALLAGLCYAAYAVTAARLISGGISETTVMGALFGGAAILLAPVLAATSPGWLLSGRGLAVTAYLGLVTTVAAYLLYGRGLRTVPAPVAVTLGLAEPVVAALLGVVVLGERLTGPEVAGLVLVGLAIAILTLGRQPAVARMSNPPPG